MSLRIYAVLDARTAHIDGPARLWVVAARKADVPAMLAARGITWREASWGSPVDRGPFTAAMERRGLCSEPAVYAYPMPWSPDTPLLRIEARSAVRAAVMGDVLGHLVGR